MDLGPDSTVERLIAARPEARAALRELGIDICCGGALTLAQAAEIAGLPLAKLLGALGIPERAPADALIAGGDSIRAVLARFPGTTDVFARHGLMGCGGAAGPDERIDLFASVHRIDLATLLAELNAGAAQPAELKPPVAAAAMEPTPIYGGFLRAAMIATFTMGATFGAYNLLWTHLALGPVPPAHKWAHAGFQIWGFVLLFVMGVGYHVLPRFMGTDLARPHAARATLWLGVAALVLCGVGRLEALVPGAHSILAAGGLLTLVTVLVWARVLHVTWRRSGANTEPTLRFVAAGTLWWVVAAAMFAAGTTDALLRGGSGAAYHEPIYAAALFGGALSWIQGVFLRTGPRFLGLPSPRPRAVAASFWLTHAGALLVASGAALLGRTGADTIADLGLLSVGTSVALYVVGLRPFGRAAPELAAADPQFAPLLRLAFGSSLLFAALAGGYALADLAGATPPTLVYDGARHAFTLGFVTLMIFAMAGRILPIFGGAALRWPALRATGGWLIFAGMLLRQAQIGATLFGQRWLLYVSGLSGLVAATGVTLCCASLLGTLRAARKTSRAVAEGEIPLSADALVADLLAAHPEALSILVASGFAPLANPLLRRTLGRAVTLRQACRMHGVDVDPLLDRMTVACRHARPTARVHLPMAPQAR